MSFLRSALPNTRTLQVLVPHVCKHQVNAMPMCVCKIYAVQHNITEKVWLILTVLVTLRYSRIVTPNITDLDQLKCVFLAKIMCFKTARLHFFRAESSV